jgi:hypothetical protein
MPALQGAHLEKELGKEFALRQRWSSTEHPIEKLWSVFRIVTRMGGERRCRVPYPSLRRFAFVVAGKENLVVASGRITSNMLGLLT